MFVTGGKDLHLIISELKSENLTPEKLQTKNPRRR